MGNSEIDTMKNMMAMSVYYIIADAFDIDAMDIEPKDSLENDLHMTDQSKQELNDLVIDMFNGQRLDFSTIRNVQDIVDQVARVH